MSVKPKSSLRKLLPFLRPYRWQICGAGLALTVAALTVLLFGLFLQKFVDNHFLQSISSFLTMFLIICALALASFSRFYLVSWIGERVVADLRKKIFRHVLHLDVAWFEQMRTGDLISRLTTDTVLLQLVVTTSVPTALRNFLTMIGAVGMLFVTSFKLSFIVLLIVPLVFVPLVIFGRKVRVFSKIAQQRLSGVSNFIDENIHAIRTVKAFAQEHTTQTQFDSCIGQAFEAASKRIRARAFLTACVILIVAGSVMSVLWLGGSHVHLGRMSAGELSSFIFYAVLATASVGALSDVAGNLQKAAGAASRLFELLEQQPHVVTGAKTLDLPQPVKGAFHLENISFSYPARPTQAALKNVSLTIEAGETVAIVGMSGAGKSTLFQLLLRFYDPQEGVITLDGIPLKQLCPKALRTPIGFVTQEPVIFATTVLENIRYGHPDASEDAVHQAARDAHAEGFIQALPEQFNTQIGERGVLLSGGQRQRLALARVLLRNPAILLLDEPTNALDSESEKAIQDSLSRTRKTRTTLIIAHRLTTVQNADRIIVLDHGSIVEQGTHESLLKEGGLYAHLAALQFFGKG